MDEYVHNCCTVLTFATANRENLLQMSAEALEAELAKSPSRARAEAKRQVAKHGLDAPIVVDALRQHEKLLGWIERAEGPHIAGADYSLADAAATPYIWRLEMLKLSRLWDRRPRVAAWYERVRQRPSLRGGRNVADPGRPRSLREVRSRPLAEGERAPESRIGGVARMSRAGLGRPVRHPGEPVPKCHSGMSLRSCGLRPSIRLLLSLASHRFELMSEEPMSIVQVRGVNINYQVLGKRGPWMALSPGGRLAMDEIRYLAEPIAQAGYRVLIHDRRNCGASEVAIGAKDWNSSPGPTTCSSSWASSTRCRRSSAARPPVAVSRSPSRCATARRCGRCCCGASPAGRSRPTGSPRTTTASTSRRRAKAAWRRCARPSTFAVLPPPIRRTATA